MTRVVWIMLNYGDEDILPNSAWPKIDITFFEKHKILRSGTATIASWIEAVPDGDFSGGH